MLVKQIIEREAFQRTDQPEQHTEPGTHVTHSRTCKETRVAEAE